MARLLLRTSGSPSLTFLLNPGLNRLGRNATNELRIPESSVSGFHCEITVSENSVLVRDLGSTNGTHINGDLVEEGTLEPGESLQIGRVCFLLEIEADAQSTQISIPELSQPKPPLKPFLPDGSPACLRHSETPAIFECATCHYAFCEECIRTVGLAGGKSMHFCLNCDGHCHAIPPTISPAVTVTAAKTKAQTFLGRLTQTLRLPFKR